MRTLRHLRSNRSPAVKLSARIVVSSYAAFAALNAQAADLSRVTAAFGNTVISTYPDGRSQKIWLHPDGTWDGLSRRNAPLAGRWTVRGQKVCLRQSKPPTLPVSFCTPFPEHTEPGVEWASHDIAGTPIHLSLQPGATPQLVQQR